RTASEESTRIRAGSASASVCGIASSPPMPGMSRSSRMTSAVSRRRLASASSALLSHDATARSGSAAITRARTARTVGESSTTSTRTGSRMPAAGRSLTAMLGAARMSRGSGRADEQQLDLQGVVIERLHHVFVRPRGDRLADVRDIVLGGAEDDLGLVAAGLLAQRDDELDAAHHRHVPVEQDQVGHRLGALAERVLAVFGLAYLETETLDDMARNLADYARVIDDQAALHPWIS